MILWNAGGLKEACTIKIFQLSEPLSFQFHIDYYYNYFRTMIYFMIYAMIYHFLSDGEEQV